MATFLDLGVIQYFDFIYPMLLAWAVVFALLQKTKVVGDKVGINAIIAVAAAFMVLLSTTLMEVINFMVPWFVVVIIFFILIILVFQTFGVTDLSSAVKDKSLQWTIIGISIVIVVAAFGHVLGQSALEGRGATTTTGVMITSANQTFPAAGTGVATESFETNIYATLFHPKVLGMIVLFAIAIFAVALLTSG